MAKQPQSIFDMDFTKVMADFKLPAVDMEALLASQRKNIEAFSAANKVALEGAQAVAKRNMEIVQAAVTEMSEAVKALAGSEAPQAKAARQAELMKTAYERAVTNMRELADMIQRANGEALGLINKRFAETMDELKVMVEKAKA
ncbi:MAG: TIGR01841 family phasin [Acetobacteraceae bacterium]|nr:TIGR01841 family phasin [Acetobacteraceae bacterium]